jgi:hypothetical protein
LDHEYHDMNETRETATADVYPAIARSAGDIAASRAEEPGFFHKKVALCATFL